MNIFKAVFLIKSMEKEMDYNFNSGNVPVLYIKGKTLPEAYHKSLLELWNKGFDIPTSFDLPGEPKSKDATVLVEVEEPFAEPRISKFFIGDPSSLEHYRLEVTHGAHDHWVKRYGTEWNYTYHERLRKYNTGRIFERNIDQIENMTKVIVGKVEKAKKEGKKPDITNRRFQIITWIPRVDPFIIDPPCLQRLHFRIAPEDNSEKSYKLNLNTSWRSRDAYKAWFMNVYAVTELQRLVAKDLSERTGLEIKVGRYTDISDSLHIYGKYLKEQGGTGFGTFLKRAEKESLESLAYYTEDVKDMIIEGRRTLKAQLDYQKKSGDKARLDPDLDKSEIMKSYPYPAEWDK